MQFNQFVAFKGLDIQGVVLRVQPKLTENEFREMYLDFVNNFLTVSRFAEYYGVKNSEARQILKTGKILHENFVASLK